MRCPECRKNNLLLFLIFIVVLVPPSLIAIVFDLNDFFSYSVLFLWLGFLVLAYYKRKSFLYSKEVKSCFKILNEMESEFKNWQFNYIKSAVEDNLIKGKDWVTKEIRDGKNAKKLVLFAIASSTEDLIISGHHHIYRGQLDSIGNDYLEIYNTALKKMVNLGFIADDVAFKMKNILEKNIKNMG